MLSEEVKDVASRIGQFYLEKNHGDYKAAEKEITDLRISEITVVNNIASITTARPGLLIGKKGTNIDALNKYLQAEIRIIEDKVPLCYFLIPYPFDESGLT